MKTTYSMKLQARIRFDSELMYVAELAAATVNDPFNYKPFALGGLANSVKRIHEDRDLMK